MSELHFSNFLGCGYVIHIWPVQSGSHVCWEIPRRVSLPLKKIQSRKPLVSPVIWHGCESVGSLGTWPLRLAAALAMYCPASRLFDPVRWCLFLRKLLEVGILLCCCACVVGPSWEPFAYAGSLSLINSGNYSPHQVYSAYMRMGTTRPNGHSSVNDLPQMFSSQFIKRKNKT